MSSQLTAGPTWTDPTKHHFTVYSKWYKCCVHFLVSHISLEFNKSSLHMWIINTTVYILSLWFVSELLAEEFYRFIHTKVVRLISASVLVSSHVLNCFIPLRVNRWRQAHPLDESLVPQRSMHLWVWNLLKGTSAVLWKCAGTFPYYQNIPEHLPCFVWGINWELSASQTSSQQTEQPPPAPVLQCSFSVAANISPSCHQNDKVHLGFMTFSHSGADYRQYI